MPKTAAFIFINGFLQGVNPSDGLFALYWHFYHLYHDRLDTLILHLTENADMRDVAQLINRHNPLTIHIATFSYGAGRGLTNLSTDLYALGRSIDTCCMIDPVQRYGWLTKPRALGWFGRDLVYQLPGNVDEAYVWRQVNHRKATDPVGHRVVVTDPATVLHPETVFGDSHNLKRYAANVPAERRRIDTQITHSTIDGNPTVHREIIDIFTSRVRPPKKGIAA